MFQLKKLTTIEEMHAVQLVEQHVWNTDVTPIHQTFTATKNGGLVLGAYKDGELIGFQYSFPGYKDGHTYLCSHMLGIVPSYRNSGVGKLLKDYQRQLAIEMGYSLIVWTYDPLESVNAYLNLHKLRGIGAAYLDNHYGAMTDSLNNGLPTDRFLVEWWIRSDHVKTKPTENNVLHYISIPVLETSLDTQGFPTIASEREIDLDQAHVLVPIPDQFQVIKKQQPELALEWRLTTRKYFQTLCENGFVAVDIVRHPEQKSSSYIFQKRDQLTLT